MTVGPWAHCPFPPCPFHPPQPPTIPPPHLATPPSHPTNLFDYTLKLCENERAICHKRRGRRSREGVQLIVGVYSLLGHVSKAVLVRRSLQRLDELAAQGLVLLDPQLEPINIVLLLQQQLDPDGGSLVPRALPSALSPLLPPLCTHPPSLHPETPSTCLLTSYVSLCFGTAVSFREMDLSSARRHSRVAHIQTPPLRRFAPAPASRPPGL